MHICFLCNEYPPGKHGGVGSFTQTLARSLVARGHKATIVGYYLNGREGVEDDQGVRVIRLANSRVRGAGFIFNGRRVRRVLAEVHAQSPIDLIEGPEFSLAVVPKNFPARKVIRMNGGHHFFHVTLGRRPHGWRSWVEHRSFNRADHLCAVSRHVAETTRALLGLGAKEIEILPNPVDPEQFQPSPYRTEEDNMILFAGTLCEKKGVRQLIGAMPQIICAVPDARLVLAGRDSIDPLTGESYAERLRRNIPPSLEAHIEFKGAVEHDELPDLIARAAVCVYPSHMEAMPLAWLEGMAMGKAVVASRTGPGPEVIEDGVSGLLCDPHDPSSIAARVVEMLKDRTHRQSMGRAARARILERFAAPVMVERNESFYRHCLTGN